MKLRKRDTHYHTYADYLMWSASHGDEVIDGTAYVREPPSPSFSHQGIVLALGYAWPPASGRVDSWCLVR